MADPYELFAESAHRGLGCKACHKPSFAGRSQMALTQILTNPDSLTTHAEVPNEKCTSCHVEGDPETWESIRNSVGHRVHFESDDPSLDGLNCVECHSSSLHQFAATSETCAQSGCHEDATIQLGRMGDFTIHCTACHNFSDPVPEDAPLETLVAATQPDAESCLSCHAMRTLVDMPEDEPHEASCGACHDPHGQTTPEQAVETCATAGCHAQPDTLTPFHRGLTVGVLSDCTSCHGAHDWQAEGQDCLSCHQDVFDDPAGGARLTASNAAVVALAAHTSSTTAPASVGALPVRFASSALHAGTRTSDIHVRDTPARDTPARDTPVRDTPARMEAARTEASRVEPRTHLFQALDSTFVHAEHRTVECQECHLSEEVHGAVTTTSLRDCRTCHHTQPIMADCAACHDDRSAPSDTRQLLRTVSFTVTDPMSRELPFDHPAHETIECQECHEAGLELSASAIDCASCHEDHHEPEQRCASCHLEAPEPAHTVEVHVGCTGSGCHTDVPGVLNSVPRTRSFCLSCHQELEDHRPGEECEQCHELPDPIARGDATP